MEDSTDNVRLFTSKLAFPNVDYDKNLRVTLCREANLHSEAYVMAQYNGKKQKGDSIYTTIRRRLHYQELIQDDPLCVPFLIDDTEVAVDVVHLYIAWIKTAIVLLFPLEWDLCHMLIWREQTPYTTNPTLMKDTVREEVESRFELSGMSQYVIRGRDDWKESVQAPYVKPCAGAIRAVVPTRRRNMSHSSFDLLKDTFGDRLISRFGPVNWPPRSCDLTPLDFFLWGYVKSLVYADKPQTLDHLEDNIRRVIADIRPQMLEKVIENWTSRLDYIRASRGSHMPEIIFKM
ncbi:hypothetical protein TNCV_3297181 [Trichonephila clavipes]|uniref:Uncharacterized protein n=1 Tax=Trichonephila clavipes TaxID=2585209 RepID=A0A8X6VT51_TRICX|nr:hypothetical protein TNCV_3297181 [Trichonephila clavipes]